jgi:hypothetical protein
MAQIRPAPKKTAPRRIRVLAQATLSFLEALLYRLLALLEIALQDDGAIMYHITRTI